MERHYQYDLVLLDLMLPGVEGCEVLRRMRAMGNTVPVLVLSGLSRPEARVRAYAASADDYMMKPYTNMDLVGTIRMLVARSKEEKQEA